MFMSWQPNWPNPPTRFKILISYDNASFEWPAQLSRVQYDLVEPAYRVVNSVSNLDCFNQCINDMNCKFAIRSSKLASDDFNCQLKNVTLNSSAGSISDIDPDSEYVELSDYKSSAILKNVGLNRNYSLQVAVMDNITNYWSDLSYVYPFDNNICKLFYKENHSILFLFISI